jgi:hypothetical protein
MSYVYDLPVGKGHAALSKMNKVGELLLGGWQTNGIFTAQSGNPLDVTVGLTSLTGTNSTTRPNIVAGCNPNNINHTPTEWFNTACFVDSFIGTFGDAGRDVVIGPGTVDFDASLLKNFPFFGERYVQFRTEVFNVFNHPIFDNPTTTETSSAFGRITSAGVQDPRWSSREIQFALRLVF